MQEVILFYNGLGIPTRQILDLRGVIPSKTAADAKERGFGSLPSSTEANPRDQVKSISTTIEADSCLICHIGSAQYAVSTRQNRTLMYETRQTAILFPSHLNGVSISVMPLSTYLNLGLGELAHTMLIVELADRTVIYRKGIAKNVLDYGRDFVLNRSLDPFFEDYIELNDLNEPFKLRRNQDDDLMPTIKEGEVIEEFRTRDDELDAGIDDYTSYCDYDKKIHIDCTHNLKFSCMIGFEFTHANFFPLLYVNVMSKKFHNSKMKDKMVYKGNNVIGALMNMPIFIGTFSVVPDFIVLENIDDYHDKGMGDVIFGEPFFREVGINAKRFEWVITIYNGNDEVTYQMV
ncbi:hypothetical protein Tco_0767438 [Tanacetum coccineum]